MKRLLSILTVGLVLLMSSTCFAAPNLVCDQSTGAMTQVEVEVTKDGVVTVYPGPYVVSGGFAVLLDVGGFSNGAYTFRARWSDASGWWSDWSDPLTAIKTGKPGGFKIK